MNSAPIDYIKTVHEYLKEDEFKNSKPVKSILTESSKEVSILNKSIKISPKDMVITIRGRYQSSQFPTQDETKSLKKDFDFFIENKQKDNGETYEGFIKRRIDAISEHNPHMMCLCLEDSEGEFKENDKIHISLSNGIETYKKLDIYANENFDTVQRLFYQDFKIPNIFTSGIVIKEDQKSFEITAFREKELLEIKNFKLYLECDKWENK